MRFRQFIVLGFLFYFLSSFQIDNHISVLKFANIEPHLFSSSDTVYVVNFWASWCKPCVEELPSFDDAYLEYKNKPVKFLLVSLDFPSQIDSRLIPFLKENKISAPVVLLNEPDADKWIDKVDSSWSGVIPATLVSSRNGKDFFQDKMEYLEIVAVIEKHLDNK